METSYPQYGSNIPGRTEELAELAERPRVPPPSPASSDDIKAAPVAMVLNNNNGRQRHRLRCVPDDACEAFTVAVVVVLVILGTSVGMVLGNIGDLTVAYSWIGAILGMALIKMTKATLKKPHKNKVVAV